MIAVAFFDNEIEAELARGRFESEGIPAQVRFSAAAGQPRYVVGYGGFGMRAPLSTYEVLVPHAYEHEARRILAERSPRGDHAGRWRWTLVRIVAVAYLVPLGAALVLQVLALLRDAFGR